MKMKKMRVNWVKGEDATWWSRTHPTHHGMPGGAGWGVMMDSGPHIHDPQRTHGSPWIPSAHMDPQCTGP